MVVTLELNNRIFVLRVMFLALQIGPIILNAVLALPFLIFTSLFQRLRLSDTLLMYVKKFTSYKAWSVTIRLARGLVFDFKTLVFL